MQPEKPANPNNGQDTGKEEFNSLGPDESVVQDPPPLSAPAVNTPQNDHLANPDLPSPQQQSGNTPVQNPQQPSEYSVASISAVPNVSNPQTDDEPSKKETMIIAGMTVLGGVGPGLILAGIYLIIKYFIQKKSENLRNGLGFVVIGAIITGAFYYFFIASSSKTVELGSTKISLELPSGNKVIEQKTDYILYGVPASGSEDLYVGQITLSTTALNDNTLNAGNFESIIKSSAYKSEVGSQLANLCPNPRLTEPHKIDVVGLDNTFQTNFICPKQSDGSEYGGYLIDGISKKTEVFVIVAAEKALWDANSKQWDAVIPSLKIESK